MGQLTRGASWAGLGGRGPGGLLLLAGMLMHFPFPSGRKQKEKHRGIWEDFEKSDHILKDLRLGRI